MPFNQAERFFESQGWEVVNPAKLDEQDQVYDGETPQGTNLLRLYLHRDFKYLANSDAIVMLPGWGSSKGANAELAVARMMGLPVYFFEPLGPYYAPISSAMPKREILEVVIGGSL